MGAIPFSPMATAAKARRSRGRAAAPDFHAIGDYGFLSDCHTGALVASDGTVEWLCVPRFDSPSLFGRCSTATRVRSASGPGTSERPSRGGTCPART